ncbi:hypothetical protein DAEQUDRAFT_807085 [Daedalea quercina L-15889]|uniref:Uncharacterized protein n=1 Tax=Daedalea quercina L-15889 TaxID=1314783 RepID=A0A165UDP0_9APHY|nr:hypothetical protein DAEQUDRAFT_807085 [Daedalea quercina L-15889]
MLRSARGIRSLLRPRRRPAGRFSPRGECLMSLSVHASLRSRGMRTTPKIVATSYAASTRMSVKSDVKSDVESDVEVDVEADVDSDVWRLSLQSVLWSLLSVHLLSCRSCCHRKIVFTCIYVQ